jgi:hypothetical protein
MNKLSSDQQDPTYDRGQKDLPVAAVSRRSVLLGGATLATTTALVQTTNVHNAQANSSPRHQRASPTSS